MNIAVIHRSDGAGTTFVFTDYLSAVSPAWKEKAGRNTALKWPIGIGAKGNEGVAGQVEHLPGSIGFVELIYAQQNKMAIADLKNRAGEFITPSVDSVAAALAAAEVPDDFRFSIVNPGAHGAYPIAGVTWLLVYEKQRNPAKGKKLVEFFKWMLTQGDRIARELSYAPLPDALAKRVLARVEAIQF
jgi:phosphate transport system substrate-binding protein